MSLNSAAGRQLCQKSVVERRKNLAVSEFLSSAQDELYLTPRNIRTLRYFDPEQDRIEVNRESLRAEPWGP